jgi:hypothetical protein
LFSLFSLTAFAADTESITDENTHVEENLTGDTNQTPAPTPIAPSDSEVTPESIFALAYERLCAYSTEIFSAFTLICSVVIVFFYKKGLTPMLKSGIGALSATVKSIVDKSDKQSEALNAFSEEVDRKITDVSALFEKASLSLDALAIKLESAEAAQRSSEVLKSVLTAEVEMLYEIFMSASLPQYEKDRIGERVAAMKAALSSEATSNEA